MVSLKLGIDTGLFMDLDLKSAMKIASEIGYEGIEISSFHRINEDEGDEIFDVAASLNLDAFCVQGGNPYTDLDFVKRSIDMASRIGARFVNIGPGVEVREGEEEAGWDETLLIVAELLEYARERGISLAVEPEPRFSRTRSCPALSSYTKDVRKIVKEFPELWTIIDLNHVFAFRESLPTVARMFQDRIANVHVSDQVDRRHFHLMPGRGEIDFGSALKVLEYSGYDEFLTIELHPYHDVAEFAAREAFEYMTNLLYYMDLI